MLRLAHRILSQAEIGLRCLDEPSENDFARSDRHIGALRNVLRLGALPIIVADNVVTYLNTGIEEHPEKYGFWESLPSAVPPFQSMFIEYALPPSLSTTDDGKMVVNLTPPVTQGGVWLTSAAGSAAEIAALVPPNVAGREAISGAKWGVIGHVFGTAREDSRVYYHGNFVCLLDPAGKFQRMWTQAKGDPAAAYCLWTCAFFHCKNVNRLDVTSEEGPPPKWCRRQRVPELKYHALQIDPNIGAQPRAGARKTEGDRSGKALHICRGHFAHFINDGVSTGLFGRRQFGTFWVPAHTRGSVEHGNVVSTYNVNLPCNS